jgi:hypothetical protein
VAEPRPAPDELDRAPILFVYSSLLPLRFGDPQIAIGVVYALLVVLFATAFTVIARQAGTEVGWPRVHDLGYWLRNRWLAVLVVLGVFVIGISLFDLPYASGSGAGRTKITTSKIPAFSGKIRQTSSGRMIQQGKTSVSTVSNVGESFSSSNRSCRFAEAVTARLKISRLARNFGLNDRSRMRF